MVILPLNITRSFCCLVFSAARLHLTHTLWEKALNNIELVDKNYHLENNLHGTQGKIASIFAQNQLLQEQLLAFNQGSSHSAFPMAPNNKAIDKEDIPMSICGGQSHKPSLIFFPVWQQHPVGGHLRISHRASSTHPQWYQPARKQFSWGKGEPPGSDWNWIPGKGKTGTDVHITGACMPRPTPIGEGACPLPPRLRVSQRKLLFLPRVDDSKWHVSPHSWVWPNVPEAGAPLYMEAKVDDL